VSLASKSISRLLDRDTDPSVTDGPFTEIPEARSDMLISGENGEPIGAQGGGKSGQLFECSRCVYRRIYNIRNIYILCTS
jgi:hypothetical protein